MAKGIELLQGQKEARIKQIRAIRSVRMFSLLGLLLYCLVVGLVFSYSLYIDKQQQNVKQNIENKKQKILSLKKTESQQIILKDRLSYLKKYFDEQKLDYDKTITFLEALENEDVNFSQFTTKEDLIINLTGKTKNATVLSHFLESLEKEDESNPFKEISLSNVGKSSEGMYSFTLKLTANEGIALTKKN